MSIFVTGITIMSFPTGSNPKEKTCHIHVLYPVKPFESEKFVMEGSGFTTNPNGKNVQPLLIDSIYAQKIVDSRAFLPKAEYLLVTGLDDEMRNVVQSIEPVDAEMKKHFQQTLQNYKS